MTSSVKQLGSGDAEALRALLAQDPIGNLFLLGLFEEFGPAAGAGGPQFAFWARTVGQDLRAAVFVGGGGGLVVPSASEVRDIEKIAERLVDQVQLRSALGEVAAVEALVRHLSSGRPRLVRTQRLFSVSADDLGPFTNPTLRLAREEDLPRVLPLAAGAIQETLERDPLTEDPDGFRARVLRRIQGKRTYVLEADETLAFKIDVGCRSQYGAELEGLFTLPSQRRRGHATLSLGQISRHLLSSLPRLTLRVDDRAPFLATVARKVGFVPRTAQKLVLAD